jgi:hypothetical protein
MENYQKTSSTEHAPAATACSAFGAGSRVRGELASLRMTLATRINVDVVGPQVWSPPV